MCITLSFLWITAPRCKSSLFSLGFAESALSSVVEQLLYTEWVRGSIPRARTRQAFAVKKFSNSFATRTGPVPPGVFV